MEGAEIPFSVAAQMSDKAVAERIAPILLEHIERLEKERDALLLALEEIADPDQDSLRAALRTGDPPRIIGAATALLNRGRDRARLALAPARAPIEPAAPEKPAPEIWSEKVRAALYQAATAQVEAPAPIPAGFAWHHEPWRVARVVDQALDALESDATKTQRCRAFDALRDLFYPAPQVSGSDGGKETRQSWEEPQHPGYGEEGE